MDGFLKYRLDLDVSIMDFFQKEHSPATAQLSWLGKQRH
jgi:hypothetical protein